MINMMYVRGISHVHTNRKDDIFMQRRLGQILHVYWSGGKGPYPARAYTTLVVLVLWAKTPLEIAMICKSVSQSAKNLNLQELLFNVEF